MSDACREVLPALVEAPFELASPDALAAAGSHLAGCEPCRDLSRALRAGLALPDDEAPDGWEALSALIAADQRTRELQLRIRASCTYCHDALERGQAVYCAACLAQHHAECFSAHGRCSAPGCGETQVVRAGAASAARRRRWPLVVGLGGLLTAAALGAAAYRPLDLGVLELRDPAPPPLSVSFPGPGHVAFSAQEAPLRAVALAIARAGDVRIQVGGGTPAQVSLTVTAMPWRDALESLGRASGCRIEELRDREGTLQEVWIRGPGYVRLRYTDANVRTVIEQLAAGSGTNIIISPEVRGTVTLDVPDVHYLEALYAIVRTVGDYEVVEERPGLLRVVSRSALEAEVETRAISVEHLSPDEGRALLGVLQAVVEQSGIDGAQVQWKPEGRAFVVTGIRPTIAAIERLIRERDVPHAPSRRDER